MLRLRSLPAGAKVTKAILVLTPVAPLNGKRFEETFVFNATVGANELNAEDWGVNKIPEAPGPFVEVDFHARRTLEAVSGSQGSIGNVPGTETLGASLQVDMGGSYVGIANDGTFMAPDKTPCVVTLPSEATPLPGLTVNKFRLSAVPLDPTNLENTTLDITNVTIRSVPTNVSMRIGQMAPFWTRLGELINAETSSDFADVLQAFLSEAEVENGFFIIPLVIHSDTIARLNVELQIEYVLEQLVLPPHLPEVTIPYNFSTVPGVDEALTTVSLPREAIPVSGRTGAQVRGEFEPTRVASGPIGEEPTTFPIVVSPKCALAQPLRSDTEIAITGIDLPLANTQPGLAGLDVAIQSDADGKPSGEILTSADVRIKKPLPDQSAWGSATLPSEFRVLPEVRYWLVLQSQVGQAYWNATPGTTGELALQCSRDGGLSWRMATEPGVTAPLAALFRLRDTPERFTVPVQLQIGKGAHAVRRRLDEFAPLGRVEFSFDLAEKLEEYLAGPAVVSPCGIGELLANGSFDQPPHDDATRRLFGFDAGYDQGVPSSGPASLVGNVDLNRGVDLSVERSITLSIFGVSQTRIDCAGRIPARTKPEEIVEAINRAMNQLYEVAEYNSDTGVLRLLSEGTPGELQLYPWRQVGVPQGWQQQAKAGSEIWRLKLPTISYAPLEGDGPDRWRPERIVAALVAEGDETAVVSQSLPVVGGCTYALRFLFGHCVDAKALRTPLAALCSVSWPAMSHSGVKLPSWEVRWLNEEGQLINSASKKLGTHDRVSSYIDGMLENEARLVAPSDAAQVEIRFIQPSPGILFLDDVSLAPTSEILRNTNFQHWEVESAELSPVGWTRLGGWLDRSRDDATGLILAKLGGGGPEDTVLTQTVEVAAEERYELRVRAWPLSPPADDAETRQLQQRARLELHWLADDSEVGDPVILPLDGRDFPSHAWAGVAPVGATRAEVRLVQPRSRGSLLVESMWLEQTDLVPVPLIFLGEVPGELTISDLSVTYDLPEPPAPPEQALPVTVAAAEVSPVVTATRPLTLADAAIGIVAGVGERFLSILNSQPTPVTTIAELATLDPETEIADIPRERRLELKTAAEMITALHVEVAPFVKLADEPLETLMTLRPADLSRRSGQRPERAAQLQRNLRALRLLLKNDDFRSLRLSDLMPGRL